MKAINCNEPPLTEVVPGSPDERPVKRSETPDSGEAGGSLAQENQRLAEENARLRQEYDLLRTLIDSLPDRIFIKDRQSRFLLNNPAHVQAMGANSQNEVIGKTDLDIFPAELAGQYYADEQAVMESGQPLNREEMAVNPRTHETRWLQTTKMPLLDKQHAVVGLMGISRDITDLKRTEEGMADAHRLLQTILDNVPDRIYFKDTQSRFIKLSKALAKRLGVKDPQDAVGKTDFDFNTRQQAEEFYQDEQRIIRTGEALINKTERQILPNGEVAWTSTTKVPLRDQTGKVVGIAGINRDITEQKRTEEALRQSRDELEKRVAERTAELSDRNAALQQQIAERERAEEALVGAQRLLQAMLDNVPDRIYFKDTESRFLKISRTLAQRVGLTDAEQAVGKTDFDFFPPEKAQEFFQDEQKILQTGQPLINKIEMQTRPDGTVNWASVTKVPLRDEAGKVIGLAGINRDITEQKRADEALARERHLMRTLIDNLPDCIYAKDTDGRKTLINSADLGNLRCQTETEALGKTDFDFFPREIAEKFWADDQKVIQGEPVINREEYFLDATGEKRWLLTSKLPLRDQSGKIIGLVGIGRNITEHKEAEEALARERLLLRTLIDNLPDFIYAKDKQGRFVLNNRAHALNLGEKSPEEMKGKRDFDYFPRDLAAQFFADEQNIIRTGKPVINQEQYKVNPGDTSGQKRWSITSKVLWRDNQGNVLGTVGVTRDIHEVREVQETLRKNEEKLRQFTTQLERSNRELQDFAYVASHDLQEPLRKIVVFGERLKEKCGEQLDPEAGDCLERMQKAASRMQNLINELLTFSRVTTKAKPFESVDLAKVADDVLSDLEGRIEQVKGRVEVGTLPTIEAEALQMRQLLQNLIGNALKFRRPEVAPMVKVEAQIISGRRPQAGPDEQEEKLCRLTVSDNGIGFDEKYLDRIFNVFQRLHSRNEYEGTGMGLAIARKIAVFHRGDITAKSKPGAGATFIVTLPVAHPKEMNNKDVQTE